MGNYFDDVTLTLTAQGGGTAEDFSCDITAATLTPDTPEEIRKRLCGQKTVTGATTWTLDLELDQNWATATPGPTGLSMFLSEHHGELADFVIQWPLEAVQATGTVRIKTGPFGGTAGEIAEASVELGLDSEPVFGPIVPLDEPAADEEPEPAEEDTDRPYMEALT
jgi:hypothetical protein